MAGYSVTFTVVDNATKQIDQINRRIAAMRAPIDRMQRSMARFVDLSGLKKVADGFNWIARAAGTALRSLTAIVPVLGVLTSAATITGMIKLVSTFASWGNQLRTNADQIGISSDELQKWQDATTRAGGNAQDMASTLKDLHKISADAFTGMNQDAAAYFRRFNISLTDSNGHLKSATQLLPEVFAALDTLKDPADRSRVAAALLGDAQAKLYETYRQSGKPLQDWIREEENHKRLTDSQLDSLNKYRLAVAGLSTDFDQLGRQVGATLANNFTPLIQHLDEFVQKHQAEIIQAVDNISKKFAAWLDNPETWKSIEAGATSLLHSLEFIINNLDTITRVAEAIAVLFATKWAIGIVTSIAQVTTAIGTVASGAASAAAGTGLAGALGAVAAVAGGLAAIGGVAYENRKLNKTMDEQAKEQGFEKQGGSWWNPFNKMPTFKNQQTGETLSYADMQKRLGYDPNVGMNPFAKDLGRGPATPAAPLGLPPAIPGQAPEKMSALPGDMSWGDYGTRANNPGNMNYASWQKAAGRFSYTDPQTGGAHTMAVYNTMEEGIADNYRLLAANQSKPGHSKTLSGALTGWAENSYMGPLAQKMGVDPNAPLDLSTADPEVVATLMQEQFRREGRKGSHTASREQILAGINLARNPDVQLAQAPPAAPPPAAPPTLNGSVTVDINHRNPPPDTTVAASGTGIVNVNAPKTVTPQLDFAAA